MSSNLSMHIDRKTFDSPDGELVVIEDFHLEIEPEHFVSILGPSGCGKTTMLRMILGLDTKYTGRITLDGSVVDSPGVDRGIVFQEPRLVPWKTVWANVEFALPRAVSSEEDRQFAIKSILDMVGLTGFESAWPAQLSGGMAQRVALARALVSVPRVLLMDEPLAALDLDTRIRMQQEILRIHDLEKTTTVMVTHDIDEALFLSDRVIVLSGRPAQIRADLRVDLEGPRVRSSEQFLSLRGEILKIILPEF